MNKSIIFFSIFFLTSCSILRDHQLPSAKDPEGVILAGNTYARDIYKKMDENCRAYGGYNPRSVYSLPEGWSETAEKRWYYKCMKDPQVITQIKKPIQQPRTEVNLGFSEAKKKCTDLGFKSGTEDFGKCVLQLSK
jgi:hypothetical protein